MLFRLTSGRPRVPAGFVGTPPGREIKRATDFRSYIFEGILHLRTLLLVDCLFSLFLIAVGVHPGAVFGEPLDTNAPVWVLENTGTFYCAHSDLWGKQPGEPMTQGAAVERGAHPAEFPYCQSKSSNMRSKGQASSPFQSLGMVRQEVSGEWIYFRSRISGRVSPIW